MVDRIFCPRCGKASTSDTSYCRTCGMSLEEVAKFVTGEDEGDGELVTKPNPRAIRLGISLFVFGTFLGLVHAALRELDLFPEAYGKIVFLSFLASGMLCMALAFVFPTSVYKRRRSKPEINAPVETETMDTAELDRPNLDAVPAASLFHETERGVDEQEKSVPSVTEHTTRKLK